jgi:hypothetical protein
MRIHGFVGVVAAALLAAACGEDGTAATAAASRAENEPKTVFELEHFTGVPRPFAGNATDQPIRGVPGGGLPWVIGEGEAKLTDDGHLTVKVEGLVFDPNDAAVQAAGLANRNTVANFRALVSCVTVSAGVVSTANVLTGPFPATLGFADAGGGNAFIDATIALPKPCLAPIVFVTNPNGAWFAVSSAVTP